MINARDLFICEQCDRIVQKLTLDSLPIPGEDACYSDEFPMSRLLTCVTFLEEDAP